MQQYSWFILFIAVNSALLLLLTINVSRLRLKHKISWGDGDNKHLMVAMRTHANGTEQVPIFALIILALEFLNATTPLLAIFVIAFTVSRVIHAYGMLGKQPLMRRLGATITYVSQLAAVIALIIGMTA